MKWLFATAALIVAGALGAFAIYTFGWRDDDGRDSERGAAFATDVVAACDRGAEKPCHQTRLEERARGVGSWAVSYRMEM